MSKRNRTKKNKNVDIETSMLSTDADLCVIFDETGIVDILAKSQPNIKILIINKKEKVYDVVKVEKEKCFTNLDYILNKILKND